MLIDAVALGRCPPGIDYNDPQEFNSLPLHNKQTTPLSLEALQGLRCKNPKTMATFNQAMQWLVDSLRYRRVPFDGKVHHHRLLPGDVPQLLTTGIIAPLEPGERPLGSIVGFTIPEWAKQRRRFIKWTKAVNDFYPRDTLIGIPVPSRAEIRHGALQGAWAISVDGKQWFDQFPYAKEVSLHMCFNDGTTTYRLTRLAMGQRCASEIGATALLVLLDFEMPDSVSVQSAADNVRFVGPRKDVVAAFRIFCDRCRRVGAQLNEIDVVAEERDPALAEGLLTQEYDFMGERFNHKSKTMQSTAKTIDKLKATWARRDTWTVREMATHFGVLFYASATARIPMSRLYCILRHYSDTMRDVQASPSLWDSPAAPLAPGLRAELERWTNQVLDNVPQPIPHYGPVECRYIICVDASGWGWGGICLDTFTGGVLSVQEPWSVESGLRGGSSVHTEPRGVTCAIRRFIRLDNADGVLVLTDHMPLVSVNAAGLAHCWQYNRMLDDLRCYPRTHFFFQHIAGVSNPVDGLSRGETVTEVSPLARQARALAGDLTRVTSSRTFGAPVATGAVGGVDVS